MSNQITDFLKYANLQMAAEALFGFNARNGNAVNLRPGDTTILGETLSITNLIVGNDHASVFTPTSAAQFAPGWTVVQHKSNTATGFSGTLFRYDGPTDAAKGLTIGELVLSIRSTEFIDDSVRDNQATNAMEIQQKGFAFGQIADMEDWYGELKASGGPLAGKTFAVTGYSLGGHLATAFAQMRIGDATPNAITNPNPVANPVTATYTFNGAGVGMVTSGTLWDVISTFRQQRANANGNAFTFSTPAINALYAQQIANGVRSFIITPQ